MLLKKCQKCQKEHPYTEFRVEHGYLRNQCRLCKNKQTKLARQKLWKKHPEKHEEYKKKLTEIRLRNVENKRIKDRIRYQENREKIRKQRKEFYHKFPELVRKRRMMIAYKITADEYDKLNLIQRCQSCGRYKKDFKKGLVIDHCHKSGKVRGILCNNCNTTLGLLNNNVVFLKNLINYLYLK